MFALGAILFFVVVGLAFAFPELINKLLIKETCDN